MVFDAREVAKGKADALEPLVFVGMDGEEYELPNMLTIPAKLIRRLQDGDEEAVRDIAPEAYEAILEMPAHVVAALNEEWTAQAGETGKSALPSSPTTAGGRRSTTTSRRAASTPRKRR